MSKNDSPFDGYILIPGLDGETVDSEMELEDAIEIESFELASSAALRQRRSAKRRAEASGEEDVDPELILKADRDQLAGKGDEPFAFSIEKQIDESSPHLLYNYYARSRVDELVSPFDSVKVIIRRAGGSPTGAGTAYLELDFEQVAITGYKLEASGNEMPTETVEFKYYKVTMTYTPQLKTGGAGSAVIAGWDCTTNTSI